MTIERARGRAIARPAIAGALAFASLVCAAVLVAPLVVQGPRFGRLVTWMLPETAGRIEVGGGTWTWGAVIAVVRGHPAPLELDDVRITDPEGTLVLRARRLRGKIELRRSPPRLVIHELRVENATWRFAEMAGGGIGFLAALRPTAPAQPSAPGDVRGFRVDGAVLDGLDATFNLPDWGLVLQDVHATASLEHGGAGRQEPLTFVVGNADVRGGGHLRVLDPQQSWLLPFSRARLDQVATTAAAPGLLRVKASQVVTGRSRLGLDATFSGVYDDQSPGVELRAQIDDASDAGRAVVSGRGDRWPTALDVSGARATIALSGPFARLHVAATGSLPSPQGGRVDVDVSVDARTLQARLAFARFATAPLLPFALIPWAGGTLQGTAQGSVDLVDGSASLQQLALTLTRPANVTGPRVLQVSLGAIPRPGRGPPPRGAWTLHVAGARFAGGTLYMPRVVTSLWGGRLEARGHVTLWDDRAAARVAFPRVDLTLAATGLAARNLLGATFVDGAVAFAARARGSPRELTIEVNLPVGQSLLVLEQRFTLPTRVHLHVGGDGLRLTPVTLQGPRHSVLAANGRVSLAGRLALAIGLTGFPFDRLPGLAQTALPLSGQVSGGLTLTGDAERPALAGVLALEPVTFQGRRVGGGLVTITPVAGGGIHASGRVIEGLEVDGSLRSRPDGLLGQATLTLGRLRLDPFLPALPGGVSVVGVLSGTIVAQMAPGAPPRADGRLSQLTLTVIPPRAPGGAGAAHPLDLQSVGEVRLSGQTGNGPIRIGPAHFAGNVGAFELQGESHGDDVSGSVRGRFKLDAFAPLTAAWVDRLSGALDIDLRAARAATGPGLAVDGTVSIAAPLLLKARHLPVEARIPTGRFRFTADAVETTGLPVSIDGFLPDSKARVQAAAAVDARINTASARPLLRAAARLQRLQVEVPSPDGEPLRVTAGPTAAGTAASLRIDTAARAAEAHVDVPLQGELRALRGPGVVIDRAAFAVRLAGQLRHSLRLSGEVDVASAHVQSAAAATSPSPAGGGTPLGAISPELRRTHLDLAVRSHGGAVTVQVPVAPALHVDLDFHVRGTLQNPESTGRLRPSGVYSTFVLWLHRLLSP